MGIDGTALRSVTKRNMVGMLDANGGMITDETRRGQLMALAPDFVVRLPEK